MTISSIVLWQELLSKSHQHARTGWTEFCHQHGSLPEFQGMADREAARRMFQRHTASLHAAAEKQQAAAQAASAFTELLSQLQPPLTPACSWSSVKPQVGLVLNFALLPTLTLAWFVWPFFNEPCKSLRILLSQLSQSIAAFPCKLA